MPHIPTGPANSNPRKRSYQDRDLGNNPESHNNGYGERAYKQPRTRGPRQYQGQMGNGNAGLPGPGFTGVVNSPAGSNVMANAALGPFGDMASFDPNNPMAQMLLFQAMGSLLGLPGFSMQQQGAPTKPGKRCFEYDSKGYCTRGSTCPYDHSNPITVPNQFPGNSMSGALPVPQSQGTFQLRSQSPSDSNHQRRTPHQRHGKGRSTFSSNRPNFDKNIKTIVIEQIPELHFTEEAVRGFFSEFGNIAQVGLQPYKRVALITYETWDEANEAYNSPKSVFDNRFVKVFWYKPGTGQVSAVTEQALVGAKPDIDMHGNGHVDPQDAGPSPEELEKQRAEAQKAQEERNKRLEEVKAQKAEIVDKIRTSAEDRKKLLKAIAVARKEKRAVAGLPAEADESMDDGESNADDELKQKLATLEAEAQFLGIDPTDPDNTFSSSSGTVSYGWRGRGRGGYRGRGAFRARGYRGRAAFGGAAGGVMRWDNRPKKIAVLGVAVGTPEDERLRQYLFVRAPISLSNCRC
jgi:RNA-binding protein 26